MMSPVMAESLKEINICLGMMLESVTSIERALQADRLPEKVDPEAVERWKEKTLRVISVKSKDV